MTDVELTFIAFLIQFPTVNTRSAVLVNILILNLSLLYSKNIFICRVGKHIPSMFTILLRLNYAINTAD